MDAVVHDAAVTTAGYQGTPAPNQWFGGPALSPAAGVVVLRDGAGLVVDSHNYGLRVDPWASAGYHGTSGAGQGGCRVPAPSQGGRGFGGGFGGPTAPAIPQPHRSAGRFPDGLDTDSNCDDFHLQAATTLSADSAAGAINVKVGSVAEFAAGQKLMIDSGANSETAVIATVGTAGATAVRTATAAGVTAIPIASPFGFTAGQSITIDSGGNQETAVIAATTGGRGGPGRGGAGATINVTAPLRSAHSAGAQVAGTGITLTTPLTREHATGAQVASNLPTPGAPNQYSTTRQ